MVTNDNPFRMPARQENEIVVEKALEEPSKAIKRAMARDAAFQRKNAPKNPPPVKGVQSSPFISDYEKSKQSAALIEKKGE